MTTHKMIENNLMVEFKKAVKKKTVKEWLLSVTARMDENHKFIQVAGALLASLQSSIKEGKTDDIKDNTPSETSGTDTVEMPRV